MKNLIIGGALLTALAFAGTASASDPIATPAPASQEGCVSPAGDTCTYTSTRTGGVVSNGGAWSVVVAIPTTAGDPRDVNADGNLTYTFGPGNAPPQGCSLFGPGATITTTAGAGSGVAAGNPFLAATDSQVSNPCPGGSLPDRTDSTPQ